jgi:hypothetical protein
MGGTEKKTGLDKVQMGRIGNRPYWVLNLSNVIRAVHQIGAAVFLTSFLMEKIPTPPAIYVYIALASGVVLFVTEGMRHRQIFRELSGLSTVLKLFLLGAAYHGYLPATPTVLLVFFLACMMSHAPKFIRHRLVF